MWVGDQHEAPAVLPPGKRFFTHSTGGLVGARAVFVQVTDFTVGFEMFKKQLE